MSIRNAAVLGFGQTNFITSVITAIPYVFAVTPSSSWLAAPTGARSATFTS